MFGVAGPEGGYIPYVVVPCESNIGDTLTFITALAIAPLTCPLVPWLCCPLDFADSAISVSPVIDCSERGAVIGATIFWSMQVFSIFGLIFAISGLAKCAAEVAGDDMGDNSQVALSFDLPEVLAEKLGKDEMIEVTPVNYVKKKVFDVLREAYKKEVKKQQQQDLLGRKDSDQVATLQAFNDTLSTFFEPSSSKRTKRQAGTIKVPIPTLLGHVPGTDEPDTDVCDRDEILHEDGDCYELLDQGPCEDEEFVIMDPKTKKGFCAPRLCAPGKVFVFGDQLCHDPREDGLCPPGRMLFTSSFGTPLCGCPDGTYEEDDDLDDDVCEPILGHIDDCPRGEVFWFTDFRSPPTCRPDPCKGLNLKRGPEDLPYVPALVDSKCYKVGSQPHFCRSDQYYSLSLKYLLGVCSSLDDAGYQVLDDDDIASFTNTFGEFISRDVGSSKPSRPSKPSVSSSKPSFSSFKHDRKPIKITPASTSLLDRPEIGAPVMKMENGTFHQNQILIGQSVVANHHPALNEVDPAYHIVALMPTHMSAFSTPLITVNGSTTMLGFIAGLPGHHFGKRSAEASDGESTAVQQESQLEEVAAAPAGPRHHRRRRSPRPFASPGNVIEPGLTACRAGARRDVNAKCRDTILPSRFPPSRPTRDVAPQRPRPSCPGGGFWGLGRSCSSSSSGIASIINRLGLG